MMFLLVNAVRARRTHAEGAARLRYLLAAAGTAPTLQVTCTENVVDSTYSREVRQGKGPPMVQAFVLVQTEVGRATAVAQQIEAVDGVVSAEAVVGPYDVIARADGATDAEVAEIVSRIQKVGASTRTHTCPVAPPPAASVR